MDIDLSFQTADDLFRTYQLPETTVTGETRPEGPDAVLIQPEPLLSTIWGPKGKGASIATGTSAIGKGISDAAKGAGDWFSGLLSKLKWGIVLLPVILLVGLYLVMRIMNAANTAQGRG